MRSFLASAAPLALVLALTPVAASAQSTGQTPPRPATQAPAQPAPGGSDRTRDLNSGPPTPAQYLPPTTAPSATAATTRPAAAPATSTPTTVTTGPSARPSAAPSSATPANTTPAGTTATRPTTPPPAAASRPTPPAASAAPATRPAASATTTPASNTPAPVTTTPAPAAAPAGPPPPAPNVPTVTVLNPAARAALPFTLDLPAGFELVTGRPGPDFKIYTVRRGEKSFAMIYAGPSSQFPLYSGETVQAAGRTSIVVTEDGQRRALEHLFERPDAPAGSPREVHVWAMSLEGQDRALAERIAQSVDLR